MILDNNARIDADALARRVNAVGATRREAPLPAADLPEAEFPLGWSPSEARGETGRRGWRQALRAVPVLGPTLAFALHGWRRLTGRGSPIRRGLRNAPLIGPVARFLWALLQLPRFRDTASLSIDRLRADIQRLDAIHADAGVRIARLEQRALAQARTILLLEARLQASSRLTPDSAGAPAQAGASSLLPSGSFYREFEDRFRGSRESVSGRLLGYLPLVERALEARGTGVCVDIGCGRGEWLELLRGRGVAATGLDLDQGMVQTCIDLGLDARAGDGIAWLEAASEGSVDVVTAFHVIEHLDLQGQLRLLDAALRALAPNGVAIFETPNPENLLVASHGFHIDPSHQRPLPPQTAEFLALQRGFARVEIRRANPFPETARVAQPGPLAERMNDLLYGPQDYALIAWKSP